jgi:hypothetical protein
MPANALTFWTSTITDTTPARAATTPFASIVEVAASPYAQNVSVLATVSFTTGADTTDVEFTCYLNSVTGQQLDPSYTIAVGTAEESATASVQFQGFVPVGTHSIVLAITQTAASADATIDAVTAVVFVGD